MDLLALALYNLSKTRRIQQSRKVLNNLIAIDTQKVCPSLYFNSPEYNPNTPICW